MSVYLQVEEYHRPQDLAQAVDILSRFGNSARVIAGGTDVLPLRAGVKKIDAINHLVDISRLGLDYLKKESDHICIGAATPINTMGASPLFKSGPYGALSEAADAHSTATIRNRATVGGNLCNASPCADLALPLLVLDAVLMAAGPEGERHIPIESFFKGANYTALNKAEVLREIRIPLCSQKNRNFFFKTQAASDRNRYGRRECRDRCSPANQESLRGCPHSVGVRRADSLSRKKGGIRACRGGAQRGNHPKGSRHRGRGSQADR